MPYVQRDGSNNIIGVFANRQPGYAEEFVADGDPSLPPPLPSIDPSELDTLQTQMKAILLCVAQLHGLTNQQMRTIFKAKMDQLTQ